ncbi:nitroreductase family protein [bacterium]|nr:nitroreductase family protein [bacterium]
MSKDKSTTSEAGVHPIIAERFSPYAYAPRALAAEDREALFEAARWAASSYNEQPWRFVAAGREEPEEFERLLSCLVEANREWARNASLLVIAVVSRNYDRNGKPNRCAEHDLGLATGNLMLEAVARGLAAHAMGGILPDRARELYGIPAGFDAFTGIAVGTPAGPDDDVDEKLRRNDERERTRRPLERLVFGGAWGQPGL